MRWKTSIFQITFRYIRHFSEMRAAPHVQLIPKRNIKVILRNRIYHNSFMESVTLQKNVNNI